MPRLLSIAAVLALVLCAPPADAALQTFYEENFNDDSGEGILGPQPAPPNDVFDEGNWEIDVSGANLQDNNDFAFVNGSSFQFRDIAGVSSGETGPNSAVFETVESTFFVGNAAGFTFLDMTLNAALSGVSGVSELVIESIINDVVVETTTLNSAGGFLVTHDVRQQLIDGGFMNENVTYELRVTATMDANFTYTIDNILLQGNSVPEPASMSLLGMGLLAMCGAGYRRRKHAAEEI